MNRISVTHDNPFNNRTPLPMYTRNNIQPWEYREAMFMKTPTLLLGAALIGGLLSNPAMADVAVGVRAGTFGFGADFDIGLTETLNLRLGYNTFSYDHTLEETDVTYDGTLKIGAASAILDWYVFKGGFHVSAGAAQKGPTVDAVGKPTGGTYEIGDHIYTAAQIGSLTGTVKLGDSVAPYIGIGWGNPVDEAGRFTLLLDIGAIRTGAPTATFTATCGTGLTTTQCTQLQAQLNADIAAEIADFEEETKDFAWYPVITLGFAIRF